MNHKPDHRPQIYLDNAATTLPLPEVVLAVGQGMCDIFANPSSTHTPGREAHIALEQARRETAALLGAGPSQVFFTSGGTESDNTVLRGARTAGIRRIVSCRAEHHAVTATLQALEKENTFFLPDHRIEIRYVNLDRNGRLPLGGLEEILGNSSKPTLVSLMHANNETGNLYDIHAIGELARRYGALYHTDAVQTVGRVPVDLSNLPADFLSASAHKFHGPKGVGLLYAKNPEILSPLLTGGQQERGMRSGTENVPGVLGMVCALRIALERRDEDTQHVLSLKRKLVARLESLPGIRFNGLPREETESLPGIVNITLPVHKDPSIVLLSLDMAGIEVSAGSACMSGAPEPSAVLGELYKQGDEMEGCPSLRISMGRFNTAEEIDAAVEAIKKLL